MKRGEIWTAREPSGKYTGKPRPILIVQSDAFGNTASVTFCPFTSATVDAPLLRIAVEPSADNGLKKVSRVMIDKVATTNRGNLGERIGRLTTADMAQISAALVVFLGLA